MKKKHAYEPEIHKSCKIRAYELKIHRIHAYELKIHNRCKKSCVRAEDSQ